MKAIQNPNGERWGRREKQREEKKGKGINRKRRKERRERMEKGREGKQRREEKFK